MKDDRPQPPSLLVGGIQPRARSNPSFKSAAGPRGTSPGSGFSYDHFLGYQTLGDNLGTTWMSISRGQNSVTSIWGHIPKGRRGPIRFG